MAKAEVAEETVTTITKTFTLTLTEEEAVTLAVILANVGGDPEKSPRKHQQAISDALYGAGIDYWVSPEKEMTTGQIMFKTYDD